MHRDRAPTWIHLHNLSRQLEPPVRTSSRHYCDYRDNPGEVPALTGKTANAGQPTGSYSGFGAVGVQEHADGGIDAELDVVG